MSNNAPLSFDAAKIRAFIDSSDEVAKHFSFIPQVAFVDKVVVPILDGALNIAAVLQSSSGVDPTQLLPLLAQEFHNVANALHTPIPGVTTSAPVPPPVEDTTHVAEAPPA